MDWIELIKYVVDKIPAGMLGIIVTISLLYWLNKSKKVPLNISWNGGPINGKPQPVTQELLRAHCEKRQSKLDSTLHGIDTKLDRVLDKQSEHGERLANLEGRFSHRRAEDTRR